MNSNPSPEGPSRLGLVRGLGMIGAIALVTGNIIGSGIYVIPASLAQVAGPVSLFAWVIVAIRATRGWSARRIVGPSVRLDRRHPPDRHVGHAELHLLERRAGALAREFERVH